MKKWLKLWIVALSLVAMATTIYTANVKAANEVKVEILWWENNCILGDYDWHQVNASIEDITLTGIDNTLYCTLLESTGSNIDLQLTDLSNATHDATIASWNFNVTFGSITKTWSLEDYTTDNDGALNATRRAYVKGANKVWEMSRTVTIDWVINAWQQVDAYSGTLHILIIGL